MDLGQTKGRNPYWTETTRTTSQSNKNYRFQTSIQSNQKTEIPYSIVFDTNLGFLVNNMGSYSGLFVNFEIIIYNDIMRIFN